MSTQEHKFAELTFQQTYQWTDLLVNTLRQAARSLGFQEILPALFLSLF